MVRAIAAAARLGAITVLLVQLVLQLALLVLPVLQLGCGGPNTRGAAAPDTSGRPVRDASAPHVDIDAGVARARVDAGSSATGPALSKQLTNLECDRFVDHVVALVAARRARAANVAHKRDDANTPEEIRNTQQKLKASMRASCLEVDRGVFNCAIAADSVESLGQCETDAAAP